MIRAALAIVLFFVVMRVILFLIEGVSPDFGLGFCIGAFTLFIVQRLNEDRRRENLE